MYALASFLLHTAIAVTAIMSAMRLSEILNKDSDGALKSVRAGLEALAVSWLAIRDSYYKMYS